MESENESVSEIDNVSENESIDDGLAEGEDAGVAVLSANGGGGAGVGGAGAGVNSNGTTTNSPGTPTLDSVGHDNLLFGGIKYVPVGPTYPPNINVCAVILFTRNISIVRAVFHRTIVCTVTSPVPAKSGTLSSVITRAAVGVKGMLGSTSDHISLIAVPEAVNVR